MKNCKNCKHYVTHKDLCKVNNVQPIQILCCINYTKVTKLKQYKRKTLTHFIRHYTIL